MNSISLATTCGTTLLSRVAKRWQQASTELGHAIAPIFAALQGGAMAQAMVPVTVHTTDHYPIRLGPSSCRPPV